MCNSLLWLKHDNENGDETLTACVSLKIVPDYGLTYKLTATDILGQEVIVSNATGLNTKDSTELFNRIAEHALAFDVEGQLSEIKLDK